MPPLLVESRPVDKKLRKPQLAVLTFLAAPEQQHGGYDRPTISDASGVAQNSLCPVLGSLDPTMRAKAEVRGKMTSLITLGYVNGWEIDVEGIKETLYAITHTGRMALQEALKDLLTQE